MYFGIINRMILKDLIKVFLMSLIALTGIFLLAGLIQEASKNGLSPLQILQAIPLFIPNTLPFTVPATTLFATCVVYGRLAADNEVLVLRSAGVNIYNLLWPAALMGLLTTAMTGGLYYHTIPRSQQILREQLVEDAESIMYNKIKADGGLKQNSLEFVMFVREVQGRDLIDVVIKKRNKKRTGYELVARAQTANLFVRPVTGDETEVLIHTEDTKNKPNPAGPRFANRLGKFGIAGGVGDKYELVIHMNRCYVDSIKGVDEDRPDDKRQNQFRSDVTERPFRTPLPESIFGRDNKLRPSAQTWNELFVTKVEARLDRDELVAWVEDLERDPEAPSPDATKRNKQFAKDFRDNQIKFYSRLVRTVETEIMMRPALAVGCLCFALIGCPVGIWASRSDYLSVFIICFLPAVFAYYPVLLATLNLAKDGVLPAAAAWVANGLAFIVALILIRRLMKL